MYNAVRRRRWRRRRDELECLSEYNLEVVVGGEGMCLSFKVLNSDATECRFADERTAFFSLFLSLS
jgi:hypothetical protein